MNPKERLATLKLLLKREDLQIVRAFICTGNCAHVIERTIKSRLKHLAKGAEWYDISTEEIRGFAENTLEEWMQTRFVSD